MPEKKRQKRWIIPAALAVLAIAVAVLATLNKEDVSKTLEQMEKNQVVVKAGETELGRFDLDKVKSMKKVAFNDQIKESGKSAVQAQFGGVILKDVLEEIGINVSRYKSVAYKAIDGYTTPGTVDEILKDDKVYVVYERDGQQTKSKSEGGTGPLEIVISNEQFSLRNCKFLLEITLSE
jgi:hypothetical protein